MACLFCAFILPNHVVCVLWGGSMQLPRARVKRAHVASLIIFAAGSRFRHRCLDFWHACHISDERFLTRGRRAECLTILSCICAASSTFTHGPCWPFKRFAMCVSCGTSVLHGLQCMHGSALLEHTYLLQHLNFHSVPMQPQHALCCLAAGGSGGAQHICAQYL